MASPLLFRPAGDDELADALRLAGIGCFVLADVADPEPVACALVREAGCGEYAICATAVQAGVRESDVLPRLRAGVADWLRARGACRLDDHEL